MYASSNLVGDLVIWLLIRYAAVTVSPCLLTDLRSFSSNVSRDSAAVY